MDKIDTREVNRDSMFLLAQVRADGTQGEQSVKVRNISDGGIMAEGPVKIARGEAISIELRNMGWVQGTVAWTQGDRFGIAFEEGVDPRLALAKNGGANTAAQSSAEMVIRRSPVRGAHDPGTGKLRSI